MSDSYFTNRQDRYIQFKDCVQVSNYFNDLVKAVADISFQLQSDNTTKAPVHIPHPYEGESTYQIKTSQPVLTVKSVMLGNYLQQMTFSDFFFLGP